MALYSFTFDAIALAAATAKTLAEISSPAGTEARITKWWLEFDGVSSAAVPVKVELQPFSAGITTGTSITPLRNGGSGGTSAMTAKHSATAEGVGAATAGAGEIHRVSPTSGILLLYPLGREPLIVVSAFWRIRATAAAIVNATFGIEWEE